MQDYLSVIAPYLDTKLVSVEALNRITRLAKLFPALSLAGLECRLGNQQDQVDFQVSLPLKNLALSKRLLNDSQGQMIINLLRNINESQSLLNQYVSRVGLEFDLPNNNLATPSIPCIFLDLSQAPLHKTQEVIDMALYQLNYVISSSLKSNLQICLDLLPDGLKIDYLGVMLSRSPQVIRLVMKGISEDKLLNYLRKIGLNQTAEDLRDLVGTLAQFSDTVALDLDIIEPIISPNVGLECFWDKQPPDEPKWDLLLNHLVAQGLCTSAKHQALINWPGLIKKADQGDLWPKNLEWGDSLTFSQGESVFWRKISHIKVSYHLNRPLEAKGYLAFGHRWVSFVS